MVVSLVVTAIASICFLASMMSPFPSQWTFDLPKLIVFTIIFMLFLMGIYELAE